MSLNNNSSSNLSSALPNIKETSLYCLISKGYLHFLPLKLGMNKLRIKERLMKCIDGDEETLPVKATAPETNKTSDTQIQPSASQTPDSPSKSMNSNTTQVNYIHNGTYSKDLFSSVKDNDYYYSHFLTNISASSLNGSIYDTTKSSSAMIDINSDFSNQSEEHSELSKVDESTLPLSADFSSTSGEDLTELLKNYSSHSIYLPNHYIEDSASSNNPKLKEMLYEIFPHWEWENEDIKIVQLTGGITNMLLSCSKYNKETKNNEKILVRSYGRGTSLIIDRDREFVSHLVLNSFNLAPPIHCRFGNGLVYGYLKGRSISPDEMALPYIYPFIAQRLGQWHNLIKAELIDESILKFKNFNQKMNGEETDGDVEFIKDIWNLIKNWIKVVPAIDGLVKVCEDNKDIQEPLDDSSDPTDLKTILTNELNWLYNEISQKSPIVVSHCDLLSGNVIIPKDTSFLKNYDLSVSPDKILPKLESNPISFIDYEYMMPAPRAFDISNHFMEWQGFDCNKEKIPLPSIDNVVMKNWAKSYLHLNGEHSDAAINEEEGEKLIKNLIDEIYLYYGLPGFYWGVWAGIQSNISLIDFDYSTYSGLRLSEYWDWKRKYLSNKK